MRSHRILALLLALLVIAAGCGSDSDDSDAADNGAADQSTDGDAADDAPDDDDGDDTSGDDTAGDDTADDEEAAPEDERVSVAILLPCAVNDLSWCQAALEGITEVENDGLIDLQVVDNAPFDAQGATRVMTGFAEEGVDLIIGHSFDYGVPIHELATEFPDTHFIWQGSCGGFCGVEGPNIADYSMPLYEPAYLSGILAGGLTETGVIGASAGFDVPTCRATLEAFLIGAQEIAPDATRLDTFTGSWTDAALSKEAAIAQAEQGADVFVACGDGVSIGMYQAAREQELAAFGYVYDGSELAPDNIVASMAWQTEETFRAIVNDISADSFQPLYEVLMADGGFEVVINEGFSVGQVSPEAQDLFDTRLAEVQAGTFEVPFIGAAEE